MPPELPIICFVAPSKQKIAEMRTLFHLKEQVTVLLTNKSPIDLFGKNDIAYDVVSLFIDGAQAYTPILHSGLMDDRMPAEMGLLFIGDLIPSVYLDELNDKYIYVDFLSPEADSELAQYKLKQSLKLRGLTFKNISDADAGPLLSSSDANTITELQALLAERTHQLIRQINENIQARLISAGNESAFSTNDGFINSLLDTIPNPIFIKNEQGIYIGCNKAFERVVKQKKNDILGKSAFDFLDESFAQKLSREDKIILENNKSSFKEDVAIFKDGTQVNTEIYRTSIIIDKVKKTRGLIGTIVDVSSQRISKQLLQIQHDIDFYSWSKGSLKKSMQFILKKLSEIDWVYCGGIYLFSEDGDKLELICHMGLSDKFLALLKTYDANSPHAKMVKKNKSYFGNFTDLSRMTRRSINPDGIQTMVVVPLFIENKVIGALNLASKKDEKVLDQQKIAIQSIAAKIAIVVSYLKALEELQFAKSQLEKKVRLRTLELKKTNNELLREMEFHKRTKDDLFLSENLYRSIFNNAQDSIVLYDAITQKPIDFNHQAFGILGYTYEEFIGLTKNDYIIYSDEITDEKLHSRLMQDSKVVYEAKYRTKDEQIRNVFISANLLEILDKKYILEIAHDVTRLYDAKYEIEQRDERIETLRENVSVGLFRVDNKGIILYANSFLAVITGEKNKEALIGKKIDHYFENEKALKNFGKQIQLLNEVSNYELKIKRKDDTYSWVVLNLKKITDSKKSTLYFDGSIEDITELKKVFFKLEKANNRIKTINKNLNKKIERAVLKEKKQQSYIIQKSKLESLGELAAGIAHEINQPLGIMSLSFENLQSRLSQNILTPEYINNKIESISGNIFRIRDIINHIRVFSRDYDSFALQKVNVNNVVRDVLKLIQTQYYNKNIILQITLDEELGFTIGSKLKLEQVLLNLLSNAKYALEDEYLEEFKGSKKKIIKINSQHVQNRIELSIEDNGPGIDPGIADKIYDPFFTTKPEWVGTGLGLSIIYGIINEMRGEIKMTSKPGEYTKFKIILPRFPEKY